MTDAILDAFLKVGSVSSDGPNLDTTNADGLPSLG